MSVEEIVRDIMIEQLGCEPGEIRPEASIAVDLGADSLDCIELIMALEEEFGIEIDDDRFEELATVQDIVDYLVSIGATPA